VAGGHPSRGDGCLVRAESCQNADVAGRNSQYDPGLVEAIATAAGAGGNNARFDMVRET
jgi:hypothetical protein